MSNRDDDFEFGDLFGDEDDLRGGDDRDELSFDDEFDLGEDEGLGDDDLFDELDEGDDEFLLEEEGEEETAGGTSRTFVMLAVAMIVLFVAGLGVLVLLLLREDEPTSLELTATQIVAFNATQEEFLRQTQTAAPLTEVARQTQVAADATATAEAESANATGTRLAEDAAASETAAFFAAETERFQVTPTLDPFQITQTFQAGQALTEIAGPTDTPSGPPAPSTPSDVSDVELTATALAAILSGPTPTREDEIGGPATQVTGPPTTTTPGDVLPETGLLDGQNMGMMMLVAFALVGAIFGARWLRTANNRR